MVIKKFLWMLVTMLIMALPAAALVGYCHAVEVKRLSFWAPDYLTVVCSYNNALFKTSPRALQCMSVITKINGMSTQNMDEAEFYAVLDRAAVVELEYQTKLSGENKTYREKLDKYIGLGLLDEVFPNPNSAEDLAKRYRIRVAYKDYYAKMLTDTDVDFFKYSTYDYAFGDEGEELEKKSLLRPLAKALEAKGLKRVTENPDIYIYVTQDINRNIETVYQPQQVTTTSGSASGRIVSYGNVVRSYAGGQSQSVSTENGQMKSFTTTDAYLQVSVLDAHRLDSKTAPKVWQLTFDEHFDHKVSSELFERILSVSCKNYPFESHVEGRPYENGYVQTDNAEMLGLFVNGETDGRVTDVMPGSPADGIGIKPSDVVMYKGGRKGNYSERPLDKEFYIYERSDGCVGMVGGYLRFGKKKVKDKDIPRLHRTGSYIHIGNADKL